MSTTEVTAWIPKEPGETLDGTVTDVVRGWSDTRTNGGKDMERGWYPLLHLVNDDGERVDWHAFETVAEKRVLERQPLPGEKIHVTFLGVSSKTPPKGQNAPKLYELRIDGRDPAQEAKTVYQQLGAPIASAGAPGVTDPATDRSEFGF